MFLCALIANAASFVLPISNPANLVMYHVGAMPPLERWLLSFGVPSILSIAATYVLIGVDRIAHDNICEMGRAKPAVRGRPG